MIKDKRIQKVIIYILILSMMMFISGFFVAKKAYASVLVDFDGEIIYPDNGLEHYVVGRRIVESHDTYDYFVVYLPEDLSGTEGYEDREYHTCRFFSVSTGDKRYYEIHNVYKKGDGTYFNDINKRGYVYLYDTLENAVKSLFLSDKSIGKVTIDNYWLTELPKESWSGYLEDYILYTDVDIYDNTSDELLFPRTPLLAQPTLQGITSREMVTGTMEQVVLLIPIGVGLLVSFLGLRKGLALLRKVLGKA